MIKYPVCPLQSIIRQSHSINPLNRYSESLTDDAYQVSVLRLEFIPMILFFFRSINLQLYNHLYNFFTFLSTWRP